MGHSAEIVSLKEEVKDLKLENELTGSKLDIINLSTIFTNKHIFFIINKARINKSKSSFFLPDKTNMKCLERRDDAEEER